MGDVFYTRTEAARLLKISLPTLDKRLTDGSIDFIRLGGLVRIPAVEITRLCSRSTCR